MKKLFFSIFVICSAITMQANNASIDSLKNYLSGDVPDSTYTQTLFKIAELYSYQNLDSSLHYTKLIKRKAEREKDYTIIGTANIDLGWYHYSMGNYNDALNYYYEAMRLFKKIGNVRGENSAKGNLGTVYKELGNFDVALKYYFDYLQYAESTGKKSSIAVGAGNVGLVYYELRDIEKAKKFIEQSLKLYQEIDEKSGIARNYGNLALLYDFEKDFETALDYHEKAMRIDKEINNQFGVARHYGNMGVLYRNMKKYNKAEEFLTTALEMDKELQNKAGVARHLIGKVQLYKDQKRVNEALPLLAEAKKIAQSIEHLSLLVDIEKSYTELHIVQGEFEKALNHYRKFNTLEDSLRGEAATRIAAQQAIQMEYNKQMIQDSLDNAKAQEIASIKIAKQKSEIDAKKAQQLYMWLGIGLILLFTGFIFNRFRVTNAQKKLIEEQKIIVEDKNKEITDSINYAKRIQKAILPPNNLLNEHLPNHFVFYKPKDIVAGDFYWLESAHSKVFFAAADCTGHGVPGAMVSVVCNNGLNRSVREYGCVKPAEILNQTRELVVKEFEKSEEEVKDGMDVALCSLEGTKLEYAGAHNPLWIVRKEANEIEEIKADKQPIGQYQNQQPFTNHSLDLNRGDTIYLFSDGFVDQFGGDKQKKYKSANFKKFLLSIQNEPMNAQLELINQEFENWRGELEQLDDVCVIGVRIA